MTKLLPILLLTLFSLSFSQSFNCEKASTDIEKAICRDSALGALDSELAEVYTVLLAYDQKHTDWIKQDQREWIKLRNRIDVSESLDEIRSEYRIRIEILRESVIHIDKLPIFKRPEPPFSGTYQIPHEIKLYESGEWVAYDVSDTYVFHWKTDDTLIFAFSTVTTNGHQCTVSRIATLDTTTNRYVSIPVDLNNGDCPFEVYVENETLYIIAPTERHCDPVYCGARAYLDDRSLQLSLRVSRVVNTDLFGDH